VLKKIARPRREGPHPQSQRQEIANSITHGLGALIAIACLGPLVILAVNRGNARHVISFSIFGAALVFLFIASTLMHLQRSTGRVRRIYEFMDLAGIYLVIAGTYTPFCLVTLHGPLGWTIFGVIWALAGAGMMLTLWLGDRFSRYGNAIYLLMGWLIVVAIKPLAIGLTLPGLALLVGGGLAYSIGVVFLSSQRFYHYHAIWHLFVALGALLHLAAMVFYVLPDLH
jgi:hemolysin III